MSRRRSRSRATRSRRRRRRDEAEAVVQTERSGLARFAALGGRTSRRWSTTPSSTCAWSATAASASRSRTGSSDGRPRASSRGGRPKPPSARDADDELPRPGAAGRPPSVEATTRRPRRSRRRSRRGSHAGAIARGRARPSTASSRAQSTELAIASTTGLRDEPALTDADGARARRRRRSFGLRAETSCGAPATSTRRRRARRRSRRPSGRAAPPSSSPASYRAVLEPYAIARAARLLRLRRLQRRSRSSRSAATSPAGSASGIFDEKVSIADDALDAHGLPEGLRLRGRPEAARPARRGGDGARGRLGSREAARAGRDARIDGSRAAAATAGHRARSPLGSRLARRRRGLVDELAEAVGDGIYVTRAALPRRRRPARRAC